VSGQHPIFEVGKECDLSGQFFVSRDIEKVGKVHPTLPRAWRQGRRGVKDHYV
jgi:hypothetical protein